MTTTNTIIEDTIRETFKNKSVVLSQMSLNMGDEKVTTPHYGLFLPDSQWECLPTAFKKGYTPHTVEDVVALTEAAMGAFGDEQYKVRAHWRDGHYVEVAPSDEHRVAIYGTKDNIFPRMYIKAGYDGRAFSASLGWYRDACDNLALLQSAGHNTTRKLRHTGSLRLRMDSLVSDFRIVANKWNDTVATIKQMESKQVNFADFLKNVYPATDNPSKSAETRQANRVEAIFTRLMRDRQITNRPLLTDATKMVVSAWEAYNAIQGYVQHDMSRKGGAGEWDRAILSFSDNAVRRAEELALAH